MSEIKKSESVKVSLLNPGCRRAAQIGERATEPGTDSGGLLYLSASFANQRTLELPRGLSRRQALELMNNASCGD